MKPFEYLTEEALEELVANLEGSSTAAAPPDYLEQEIVRKIKKQQSESGKKDFILYSIKIAAAAAAAIAITFSLPTIGVRCHSIGTDKYGETHLDGRKNISIERNLSEEMNDLSERLNGRISEITGKQ